MYDLIKELCYKNGTTPTKLCTDITGSSGNLPTWKKGNINPASLIKIADYFDVSVDYLLGRTDNPDAKSNVFKGNHNINVGNDLNFSTNENKQSNNTEAKPQMEMEEEFIEVFKSMPLNKKIRIMNIVMDEIGA